MRRWATQYLPDLSVCFSEVQKGAQHTRTALTTYVSGRARAPYPEGPPHQSPPDGGARSERCIVGLVVWRGRAGGRGPSTIFRGRLVGLAPAPATLPGQMAPRPLGPLVLALGGAAAVLGSVLFILWKAYFGRGRERRWDRGEAWWSTEAARLPQWDEWEVSTACTREGRDHACRGSGIL